MGTRNSGWDFDIAAAEALDIQISGETPGNSSSSSASEKILQSGTNDTNASTRSPEQFVEFRDTNNTSTLNHDENNDNKTNSKRTRKVVGLSSSHMFPQASVLPESTIAGDFPRSKFMSLNVPTKLDIASAKQITASLSWLGFGLFLYFLFMIVDISLYWTAFRADLGFGCTNIVFNATPETLDSKCEKASYTESPFGYELSEVIVLTMTFALLLLVGIVFLRSAIITGLKKLTYEQIWCALLVIFSLLTVLPIGPWLSVFNETSPSISTDVEQYKGLLNISVTNILPIIFDQDLILTLYMWAMSDTYRKAHSKRLPFRFYWEKLVVLVLSTLLRLFYFIEAQTSFSETGPAQISDFFASRTTTSTIQLASHLPVLFMDSCVYIYILLDVLRTLRFMRTLDYVKYRSKQIGFRFFVVTTLISVSFFLLFDMIIVLSTSEGLSPILMKNFGVSAGGTEIRNLGRDIMILIYVVQQAWANLPASAHLFSEYIWFTVPDNTVNESKVPVQYFLNPRTMKRSIRHSASSQRDQTGLSQDSVADTSYDARTFIFSTAVHMLNFAWIAFSYGRAGKPQKVPSDFGVAGWRLADYISDVESDTHALIFESKKGIVLSFRGTMSLANMKTDVRVTHVHFDQVFPENTEVEDYFDLSHEGNITQHSSLHFSKADTDSRQGIRIHRGFATAYASISARVVPVVLRLFAEKRRMIFFTGHSLGGALSTLCSYDIARCLRKSDLNLVFVMTFGSPRVGNRIFRKEYDRIISRHWRIVVGGDLITKLPSGTIYRHVGTKAVFTKQGLLFLDPTYVEFALWHAWNSSLKRHEKTSYLTAMKNWCNSAHPNYEPNFWYDRDTTALSEESQRDDSRSPSDQIIG